MGVRSQGQPLYGTQLLLRSFGANSIFPVCVAGRGGGISFSPHALRNLTSQVWKRHALGYSQGPPRSLLLPRYSKEPLPTAACTGFRGWVGATWLPQAPS